MSHSAPKFSLGQVVIMPNAAAQLDEHDIDHALQRHARGDWGELDQHHRHENELSLRSGYRLLSLHTASNGTKFCIITEADRSATTVLLREDY